ncbi:MAG: spondin domain-containing protein, partial [SAR324 cluster bacterium]|nr:spondin domain-containing protein [SAR324 cluster bacterium]
MCVLAAAALFGCAEDDDGGAKIISSGAFDTPVIAGAAGPATTGDSYEFTFTAEDGDKLTLATMFVFSNDLFYGP